MRRFLQSRAPRLALAAVIVGLPLVVGWLETIRAARTSEPAPVPLPFLESTPHFLWAILVTAFEPAGLDRAVLESSLSILAWAGVLAVLVVHAMRAPIGPWPQAAEPDARRDRVLVAPIAAWAVALHPFAQRHAGDGSEISLFTLLVVGGLLWMVNHPRQTSFGATLFALAALVRPEGWILSAMAFAYARWRGGWRRAGRFGAVWSALVLPYVFWKIGSAGSFALGSMFALDGGDSWSGGRSIPWTSFSPDPVLLLCALVGAAGWVALSRSQRSDPRLDVILLGLLHAMVLVLAALRNRGDVGFASLLVPLTAILYLVAEEAVRIIGRRWVLVAFGVLAIAGTVAAR